MNDSEKYFLILEQLYHGNHLNKQELERAKELVSILTFELNRRK